jgi:opacity protein-like surface antigen
LFVGGDVSLNQRLFVGGDVSLNQRLFVGGDVSLNQRLFVGGDVSLNQRLFVGGDVSLNGNVSCNNYLKVNHIAENIGYATYVGGIVNLDYNARYSLYLIAGSGTNNFRLNINNFPTDTSFSIMTTLLIPSASFCNLLHINGSATASPLLCSGGSISSYVVTNANFVIQSIGLINTAATTARYAVTNIASYTA